MSYDPSRRPAPTRQGRWPQAAPENGWPAYTEADVQAQAAHRRQAAYQASARGAAPQYAAPAPAPGYWDGYAGAGHTDAGYAGDYTDGGYAADDYGSRWPGAAGTAAAYDGARAAQARTEPGYATDATGYSAAATTGYGAPATGYDTAAYAAAASGYDTPAAYESAAYGGDWNQGGDGDEWDRRASVWAQHTAVADDYYRDDYSDDGDEFAGGRHAHAGTRTGYAGGRDGYAGGRDGYAGGRDGYAGGRDGYAGGRDGYAGGRDGYALGRDGYGAEDGYYGAASSGTGLVAPDADLEPGRWPEERAGSRRGVMTAALSGFLAAAVTVGVSTLAAAFVRPQASPVIAVGNVLLDRVPLSLRHMLAGRFGGHERVVLLLGLALAITILAVVAGLATRHAAALGVAWIAAFSLVGAFAVITGPGGRLTDLIPSVAGGVAGILALVVLDTTSAPVRTRRRDRDGERWDGERWDGGRRDGGRRDGGRRDGGRRRQR